MTISAAECSECVKTFIVWLILFNNRIALCYLTWSNSINRFWLVGLVGIFRVLLGKNRFWLVWLINFFNRSQKPGWNDWKSICVIHTYAVSRKLHESEAWGPSSSCEYRVNHGWCYVRKCRIKLCCTKDRINVVPQHYVLIGRITEKRPHIPSISERFST